MVLEWTESSQEITNAPMKLNFSSCISMLFVFGFYCNFAYSFKVNAQINAEYNKQVQSLQKERLKKAYNCYLVYSQSQYNDYPAIEREWSDNVYGLNDRLYIDNETNGVYRVSGSYSIDGCSLATKPTCFINSENYFNDGFTESSREIRKCVLEEDKIILYKRSAKGGLVNKETLGEKNKRWREDAERERFNRHMKHLEEFPPSHWSN